MWNAEETREETDTIYSGQIDFYILLLGLNYDGDNNLSVVNPSNERRVSGGCVYAKLLAVTQKRTEMDGNISPSEKQPLHPLFRDLVTDTFSA